MTRLELAIAGVRIALDTGALAPAGLERYRPFAGAGGPARYRLMLRSGPEAPVIIGERRTVPDVEGRWRVVGCEDEGALDPRSGEGYALARPGLDVLDALLRAAVGTEVIAAGGFLVHGACVVVDGRAHLFPARSGSGKSTLARTAGHPLADELCVLRPGPEGFLACATPWWSSRGGAAPLAAVHALGWFGEDVTWMPGSALRQLAANLVIPIDTPEHRAAALGAAALAARSVRWGRLRFRPDSKVDAILRAAWR